MKFYHSFFLQPSLGDNVSAAEGVKETELQLDEEILTEIPQPTATKPWREETAYLKR